MRFVANLARLTSALAIAAAMTASAQAASDGEHIELFDSIGFEGQSQRIDQNMSGIETPINNRTSSIRVTGGTWQVCKDHNFRGGCYILDESKDRLPPGINNSITSVRRLK